MPSREITDAAEPLKKAWPLIKEKYAQLTPTRHLILTTTYRSPEEQFTLYKKGRTMDTQGHWVVQHPEQVVTNVDGLKVLGAHNYFPSRAIDVTVFDNQTGKPIWEESSYHCLLEIAKGVGLESGGSWKSIKDWPHLQIPDYKNYHE